MKSSIVASSSVEGGSQRSRSSFIDELQSGMDGAEEMLVDGGSQAKELHSSNPVERLWQSMHKRNL